MENNIGLDFSLANQGKYAPFLILPVVPGLTKWVKIKGNLDI